MVNSLDDLESAAKEILPAATYDYFAGGAEDEVTLRANREAFGRYRFKPKALRATTPVRLATTIFADTIEMPINLAPTALHRLAHPDGERATARAAADAGVLFCNGTLASVSLEEVATVAVGPRWFQLYLYDEPGLTHGLIRRAEQAGYSAIVLTVDSPVLGRRERELRHAFRPPADIRFENLRRRLSARRLLRAPAGFLRARIRGHAWSPPWRDYVSPRYMPKTWDALGQVVNESRVPVVVKGVVRGDDAIRCVESGAQAIIVSNHGGRQLDYAVATLDALPDVVHAVGSRVPVMMDGGIRTGSDALIAMALGARAVFIGRPYLWALTVSGAGGIGRLLRQLRDELESGMRALGVSQPDELGPDLLRLDGRT